MRRERKAGPFIPCEVRAQMGPARATTPPVACRRRQATTAVGARVKAYPLGQRRLHPGSNACAWARTHARGRQCMCPGDNVCACATTGATWEGCFFTNTPNFSARATTSSSGRQRLRSGDDVHARAATFGSFFSNVGIFSCFGNPNKTFPLSLFENYWNCVEDGNPKLFLLVGVFLSALNRDLAFLSRHLSIQNALELPMFVKISTIRHDFYFILEKFLR